MPNHLLETISDGAAVLATNRPDRLNAPSRPARTGFTEDHREAARAFVDKPEPVIQGR